jgi:hypothetical protein
MSVQPLESPNTADAAAELISKQLRAKVESLLKTFTRFSNIEEFERRLNRLFSNAATSYAEISLKESRPHTWVVKKIRSDRNSIVQQNAARVFLTRQSWSSLTSSEELRDDLEERLDDAMDEAIRIAAGYIESGPTQGSGDSHSRNTPVQGMPLRTPREDAQHVSVDGQQSLLTMSEEYRVIRFKGQRYNLPPQRALIVKTLDEARISGKGPLTAKQIQKEAHCGKISHSFRTGDGPKLWKHLVVPVENCKGMYKLALPYPPAQ